MPESHPGIQFTSKKKIRKKGAPARPSPDAGTEGHRQTSRKRVRKVVPKRPSPDAGTAGKTKSQRAHPIRGTVHVPVHGMGAGYALKHLLLGPDEVKIRGKTQKLGKEQGADLKVLSPALKILNETTRVSHGVAGSADAWISGHPEKAAKQFSEGAIKNKKYNFGKVFKKAGVPSPAANILGFGADVATDPLTYVTFGTGSVAKKVAVKEGERVAAEEAAKGSKGITVKFAGKQVPGVTRATAKLAKPAVKAIPKRPAGAVRRTVTEVSPRTAPEGVSPELHHEVRKAARTARATQERARAEAEMQAHAIHKQIGPKNYNTVVDAIEADTIHDLPKELQAPAHALRDIHGPQMLQRERAAGVHTPELDTEGNVAQGYVYRATKKQLEGKGTGGGGPTRTVRPEFAATRQHREPLADLRSSGSYSEDLPLLHVTRAVKGGKARASAQLNERLAKLGRPVKPGGEAKLAEGEELYLFKNGEITPLQKVPKEIGPKEKLFVLPKIAEERARASLKMPAGGPLATGYDTVQRGFKRVATATPGFNVRNLIGDQWNNYLAVPGYTIPKNMMHARRLIRVVNQGEKQARATLTPGTVKTGAMSVRIGKEDVTYEQLAKEFVESGGGRTGQVGRELEELGRSAKGPKKVSKGVGRGFRRLLQNREDFPRAQTWLHYRLKGLSPEEAAAKSSDAHIDYGDLSPVERNVFRRVMPFYTFSARDIPIQGRALITHPGKFANLQKAREESGITDSDAKLSEYDQRQLPIALGGAARSVSLPATDLNEFPILAATGHPAKQLDEWANRFGQMVSPIIKNPVELKANFSFFFRDAIQNPDSPLVPAPPYADHLPHWLQKKLGVRHYVDKRSGKRILGWYGKADYIAKQIPGIPNFAQNIATESNRKGQSTAQKATAFLTGVKSTPLDEQTYAQAEMGRLYKKLDGVTLKMRALNQDQINATHPNPEYKRLKAQSEKINDQLDGVKKKLGYKDKKKKFDPLGLGGGSTDDPLGLNKTNTSDPLGLKP